MDRRAPQVKRPRAYDASGRQQQARLKREALLDAALARFLEHGYASTSVEAIAGDADVSAATIYKSYGGKPGVVRALCHRALAGTGAVPAEQRSDALRAEATDPHALIEGWGRFVAEVSPRVAPILLLLREASGHDPVAAKLHDELDRARLVRMATNARHLADARFLREGVRFRAACDVLWLYSSPEIYDLLVVRRRWSVRQYSRFVTDAMIDALL